MIDECNIPRFKERFEIRYDHRPAVRHGSDELGVRPFNRMSECELRGRLRRLDFVDATGAALCLELRLPFTEPTHHQPLLRNALTRKDECFWRCETFHVPPCVTEPIQRAGKGCSNWKLSLK